MNGPVHVSVWPDEPGSVVVRPLLEPIVYEKPAGSVSVTEATSASVAFGLVMVIV